MYPGSKSKFGSSDAAILANSKYRNYFSLSGRILRFIDRTSPINDAAAATPTKPRNNATGISKMKTTALPNSLASSWALTQTEVRPLCGSQVDATPSACFEIRIRPWQVNWGFSRSKCKSGLSIGGAETIGHYEK